MTSLQNRDGLWAKSCLCFLSRSPSHARFAFLVTLLYAFNASRVSRARYAALAAWHSAVNHWLQGLDRLVGLCVRRMPWVLRMDTVRVMALVMEAAADSRSSETGGRDVR